MPCNGGHTYSPPDHTSCEEYEKKLVDENDELTRLLCYLCGRLTGEGQFKKMPAQLVGWWVKHQRLDFGRVSRQMDARLKKKSCSAQALANKFIVEAMKAHPLSDFHQIWLRKMAREAVNRYRINAFNRKQHSLMREKALGKLTPAERKVLGLKARKRGR